VVKQAKSPEWAAGLFVEITVFSFIQEGITAVAFSMSLVISIVFWVDSALAVSLFGVELEQL
jgi:hypothetical protein